MLTSHHFMTIHTILDQVVMTIHTVLDQVTFYAFAILTLFILPNLLRLH